MGRKRIRAIAWGVVLCLWLLVSGLLLEGIAYGHRYLQEKNNPFILAKASPMPEPALAPMDKPQEKDYAWISKTIAPRAYLQRLRLQRSQQPPWYLAPAQSATDLRCKILRFTDLEEDKRGLFARVENLMVGEMPFHGELARVYTGAYSRDYFKRLAHTEAFQNVVRPLFPALGKMQTVQTHPIDFVPGLLRASEDPLYLLPDKTKRVELSWVVLPNRFLLECLQIQLPENSPWEIPFVKYRPNLKQSYSGMGGALSTNALGFRSPEVVIPKPKGRWRVICIGGSTTEEGPDIESTYPALLEKKLRKLLPGLDLEVVNCGVSGLTTTGHLARMRDYLALDPDLVIAYEGVNDLLRDIPDLGIQEGLSWYQPLLRKSMLLRAYAPELLEVEAHIDQRLVQELPLGNMQTIAAILQAHGIVFMPCTLAHPGMETLSKDLRQYYDYDARKNWIDPCFSLAHYAMLVEEYNHSLRRWCADAGLPLAPVARYFGEGARAFRDLCHLYPQGIQRKADIIAYAVQSIVKAERPLTELDVKH